MNGNWTPGPWEAHRGILELMPTVWDVTAKTDGWRPNDDTPQGYFVATVHETKDAERAEYDARLIAAAPDLLAAVESAPIPAPGEEMMAFRDRVERWKREVKAPAIAKATGAA